MTKHFSSFDLDVHFVEPSPQIAEHVASCAQCAAYLAELEALVERKPLAEPRSAPGAAPPARAPAPQRLHAPLRLVAPVAGALALAAAFALYLRGRTGEDADYVGVKAAPAVQLLVRSGGTTRVWDGVSRLRPGDAIAIRVACEQLEYVTVAADAPAGLARLSDGPCPKSPSPLPFTLVVDDQPGRERFSVVLAKRRLDDGQLRERVRENARDRDVWVTAFDLPKELP
jgi:hypothetical protein